MYPPPPPLPPRSRYQSGGEPSLQQKVPDKYFVIANDELVRVKYVLVFGRLRKRRSVAVGYDDTLTFLYDILLFTVTKHCI